MAGRKPGFRHNEDTRAKIQASMIINRLQEHIQSPEPTMDASQVNAAKALLAKTLPDLQSVSMEATHTHDVSDPLKELFERIATKGKKVHDSDS